MIGAVRAFLLVLAAAWSVEAAARPPAAAFTACQGQKSLAACQFQAPHGAISGVCRQMGPDFVCVPSAPRPGGAGQSSLGQGGAGGRPSLGQGGPASRGPLGGGAGQGSVGYTPQAPYAGAVPVRNKLADTGQVTCFDDHRVIHCPPPGEPFYGQDGHYRGLPADFRDNGDGTVLDGHTGLLWQKGHNRVRLTFHKAEAACAGLSLGGRSDWRLPTIRELFSISDFRGVTGKRFFLDGDVFDLEVPGQEILVGDRFSTHYVEMMGQTWSSTRYAGKHYDREGVEAAFFFNFLDGRIKQAPVMGRMGLFYRCVSGSEWGVNQFRDNGDGTVDDGMSGLRWQGADDGVGRDWRGALEYCESLVLGGVDDWRLPNVRELQSLVDYSRAEPAIDGRYFEQRDKGAWYWTSTTHGDNPQFGVYVCFGRCVSVDGVDVHGAGAQRSDPKGGDVGKWGARGGQRDETRIYNHVRCVRDAE